MDPFPTDRNSEMASLTLIILTLCTFAVLKFTLLPGGRMPNIEVTALDYQTEPLHVDPSINETSP
jgi:hypothetical protein